MTQPIAAPVKLAVYIRTARFNENSVARQMDSARAYWRKNFSTSDLKIYCDEGSSERPALERLVTDANSGAVDLVMVENLDRLGRSKKALLALMSRLEQSNVEILCTAEDDPFQDYQTSQNLDEAVRELHPKRRQLGKMEARERRQNMEGDDV